MPGGFHHIRTLEQRRVAEHAIVQQAFVTGLRRCVEIVGVVEVHVDVADLHHIFATCPRPRHVIKPVLTARGAAAELHEICARDLRAGVLFGPERAGLDNDDMAAADALVPLNPAFMSLNLAQAVMVLAYEWWTANDATPPRQLMTNETSVATKAELENFLRHLVDQLDACGFLRNLPKRQGMVRNIRHFFQRGEVTEQELRTLHGIVTELAIGRRQTGRLEKSTPLPQAEGEVCSSNRPALSARLRG